MGKFRKLQESNLHDHDLRQRTANLQANRRLSLKAVKLSDPNDAPVPSEGIPTNDLDY